MSILDFHVIPSKIKYQPEDRLFVNTNRPSLPNSQGVRFCLNKSEKDYWSGKKEKNRFVLLSDVANSFINLRHADHKQIKLFFEEYGMLGLPIIREPNGKFKAGFTEPLEEIISEVEKYYDSFAELSELKANRPSFESVSKNSVYSMFEVLTSINTVVSQLQHSLYIDADDDKPFFTEYIACHSLLHALYYFLYQNALLDWYKYSVCTDCGKRFLASKRKKITNLCPECIERNRIDRNKKQQRGNSRQYFKEKMHNRARHYRNKQFYYDEMDDWLVSVFDKEFLDVKDSSDIEFSNWENKKEYEWKELLKRSNSPQ